MNHLDISNQIKEILFPHLHPFLLIDYIEDYVPSEYAVGYKCVSYREEFLPVISAGTSYARCFDNRGTGAGKCSCDSFTSENKRKNSLLWRN